MAVSILEALQCAEVNLGNMKMLGMGLLPLVQSQLHNGVILLEKGYDIHEEVEPLLEEFGSVESVPEKPEARRKTRENPNRRNYHTGGPGVPGAD